jgi:hypothetical protein
VAAVIITADQCRRFASSGAAVGQILAPSGLTPFAGFRVATLAHVEFPPHD